MLKFKTNTILAFLFVCFLTTSLLAASYQGKRVKVKMKDGRNLSGLIIKEESTRLRIKLRFGMTWLKRSEIDNIEILLSFKEMYEKRKALCKTADDWVKLAVWCKQEDVNLLKEFKLCLDEAIKLESNHSKARELRGDVLVNGEWLDEETGNKKLGRVKYKGKWVSKEKAEELEKLEKLKKNKALEGFLEELEAREGRPWASVEPIETEHYYVKCNSTEKVARKYSLVMEDLYEAYDSMFPEIQYPRRFNEKGKIFIFRNHDEFMDFHIQMQDAGGFYAFADRGVRAYHGSFGVTGSTEMVLAHEATHQFQGMIMANIGMTVPIWLIEGMAVYYGDGTKFTKSGVKLHEIPRDRLATLKEAIRTGRYRKLQDLLVTPQRMFGPFYNHGWGVIYWCLQGEKHGAHDGSGKKVWDEYLKRVCSDAMPSPYNVNLMEHYAKERDFFIKLLLQHTKYNTVEEWEKDYKDFILNTLKLEPLGTWKGRKWTGPGIGIKEVIFPSKGGMKKVDDDELRARYNEAAAVVNKSGTRIWLSVDANYSEIVNEKKIGPIGQMFLKQYFEPKSEPKLRIGKFQGVDDILVVRARFKGKFRKKVESGVGGSAGGGTKKKSSGSKKKQQGFNPDAEQEFKVTMIITTDKVYMFNLAGSDASFFKLEPEYDKFLLTAKLIF